MLQGKWLLRLRLGLIGHQAGEHAMASTSSRVVTPATPTKKVPPHQFLGLGEGAVDDVALPAAHLQPRAGRGQRVDGLQHAARLKFRRRVLHLLVHRFAGFAALHSSRWPAGSTINSRYDMVGS